MKPAARRAAFGLVIKFSSAQSIGHYRRQARFVKTMWPLPLGAILEFPQEKLRAASDATVGLPRLLGRYGAFEIRLAATKKEIRKAQRLRYKVFYEEGGAIAAPRAALVRRDLCRFDEVCDHLIVIDTAAHTSFGRIKPKIIGTCRLLRGDVAARQGGFYSQSEFDIAPLLARHTQARFLELGRSCIHPKYRSKRAIELLWRGLWIYAKHYEIDVMIGCASLPGTNPLALALPLSFLHHQASAESEWQVRPHDAVPMAMLDKTGVDARKGIAALPPLLKFYVRTGAKFADGAVIDQKFGTIDVFTIMRVAEIEARYIAYFGSPGEVRQSAAAAA
jgi:L-ornithine Nalpha-acyltransferase